MTYFTLSLLLAAPPAVELTFDDQFGNAPKIGDLHGKVAVLVYGDRKAVDACRKYGEELHVLFHPTAKGLPPAEARKAPASPLQGIPPQKTPDVAVIPVACCGSAPKVVQALLKAQIKAASPDVPVWLDFEKAMVTHFGLKEGEVNVAVFDAKGQYRLGQPGAPDAETKRDLLQQIQNFRAEAAK